MANRLNSSSTFYRTNTALGHENEISTSSEEQYGWERAQVRQMKERRNEEIKRSNRLMGIEKRRDGEKKKRTEENSGGGEEDRRRRREKGKKEV